MLQKQCKKIMVMAVAFVAGLALALPAPASAVGWHHGKNKQKCQKETMQVKLAPGGAETYEMAGWLCWEGKLRGKTVQVLVSGFTYDHHYWDFPFKSNKYSYVDNMTKRGYATFNIDRVGVGESERPDDPLSLTVPAQAHVAHQVVQALRGGEIGGTSFKKVIGVGHSMGAAIWIIAAGTYPDNAGVDGLIFAGYLHGADPDTQAALGEARHSAQEDPKFAPLNLPEGYIATKPGMQHLYYNTDFADPRVIAVDEELKQTATLGELFTLSEGQNPDYTANITVPTFISVGQKDSLFCNESKPGLSCADAGALFAREAPLFGDQSCVEAYVLPMSGHDTNLHHNAKKWFSKAEKWADRNVGNSVWDSPRRGC